MNESKIAPAATVVLLREAGRGLEVLLLRRARTLVFHGGAWVFPGGRVDLSDHGAGEQERARAAALRETLEEAGLSLALDALVPFSHWTTPAGRPRRFATWFFLAQVDARQTVRVDGGEIDAHRWLCPHEALALHAQRQIELPPPTFVSLTVLTRASDPASALALARSAPPFVFVPRPRPAADGVVSLYGGDCAYDGGPLDAPGARHRLVMNASGYRYVRS